MARKQVGVPNPVDLGLARTSIFRGALSKRLILSPTIIIWRGSSSTAGNNAASDAERFVNKVHAKVSAAFPTSVGTTTVRTMNGSGVITGGTPSGEGIFSVNAGISGSRSGNQNGATPYVNATTRAAQVALNPRVFVDMIGANDYGNGVPVATYKANIIAEIDAVAAAMTVEYVHGFVHSYPRFDSGAQTNKVAPWSDYRQALYEVQALYPHVFVIDTSEEWAMLGVTGEAGADAWDYIDTDGIHMKSTGHDVTANIIAQKLLGGVIIGAVAAAGAGWTNVLLSDSFDRANSTTLGNTDSYAGGSNTAWQSNAASTHKIESNALQENSATGGVMVPVNVADYEIRFQLGSITNATGTTLWTIDGRRNQLPSSGATQYRLYPRANGTAYLAAGTSTVIIPSSSVPNGTFAVGDWIGLRFVGSTISIVKASGPTGAGTVVASVTDTSQATPGSGFAGVSRAAGTTGIYTAMSVITP